MEIVVFFLKTDMVESVTVVKGFIEKIKLLMVTMELTSSEWNFAHSFIG